MVLKFEETYGFQKKVEQVTYDVNEILDGDTNKIKAQKIVLTNKTERSKFLYDTLKVLEVYISLNYKDVLTDLDFNNLTIKVFQTKNIDIWIKKGQLKNTLGNEQVDKAVINKLQLDGMYNISFNYAFLNGEQISGVFYSAKTSLLNRKKSIPNKENKKMNYDRYNPSENH